MVNKTIILTYSYDESFGDLSSVSVFFNGKELPIPSAIRRKIVRYVKLFEQKV